MKNQEYNYLENEMNTKKFEELVKQDLEDLRLNKIEKPKLVRQTARWCSVDNLQTFYFNNTLEKYYLELIKQNS